MKIAIGCDHGGFHLKNAIQNYLDEQGIPYVDFGCSSTESCHYPAYAVPVCHAVTDGDCTFGILVCSTGIGMSMAANKCRGIRAACCSETYSARYTRMHNNANVLCLGEKVVGEGLALDMVDLFLNTQFEGGRHQTRVDMIMEIEKK